MSLQWAARSSSARSRSLAWSNSVALWWALLTLVSGVNIAVWFWLNHTLLQPRTGSLAARRGSRSCSFSARPMFLAVHSDRFFRARMFSGFVCSTLAIERHGRSVGGNRRRGRLRGAVGDYPDPARRDDRSGYRLDCRRVIVPLIVIAECFSWYAVLTRNYLGHAIENSIWGVAFFVVGVGLCRLLLYFDGLVRVVLVIAIMGIAGFLAFLATVDVPMYLARWRAEGVNGGRPFEPSGWPPRRERSLGRDARHRRVEGRDGLDVAVFQCGGLVEPCAVRLLRFRGLSDGPSYRRGRRRLVPELIARLAGRAARTSRCCISLA